MANSINATSTGNGGITTTGDDSGVLNIQTNETTAISIDASQNATFTNGANLPNTFGFKNRLINGGMVIDQRNAGASSTTGFPVDRWKIDSSVGSKSTQQQNAGSVTPPAGFRNYLGCTASGTYSVSAGDIYVLDQPIEGYNVADLMWGTSSAATVTLSFWVRSSITGTFGGSVNNSGATRCYPFTYTISAANTWEQKSVTIAGDTSGTWLTTNGAGIIPFFNLATGSTYQGTAGAWSGTTYYSATGAQNPMATSGATFYITGVQLEKGTQATSFDFRSYGTELALCQRYYQKSYEVGTVPGTVTYVNAINTFGTAAASTAGTLGSQAFFRVDMRTTATISIWDASGNAGKVSANPYGSSVVANNSGSVINSGSNQIQVERGSGTACNGIIYHYAASAEL